MPEHSDPDKMVKLGFAKRQLELSSGTVLEMSGSIQALIDKLEKTKAKNEKKKQKMMEEFALKCQELEEMQKQNEELIATKRFIIFQPTSLSVCQ